MSIENVKTYLQKFNMSNEILKFNSSSATVIEASLALNCEPKRIAKTLSFIIFNTPVLIVLAGDVKIDNQKFKHQFNEKAKMIPNEMVQELIGHNVGGVCPFAVKENVKTYLDNSLKRFDFVYPACGSANSAIKLTLNQLEQLSNYISWIDVSKSMEELNEIYNNNNNI